MIKDVVLPEISETVESGDVIEIFVKAGDSVEVEQPLVQLETDKATFDVPSPVKGKVVEVLIEAGQKVKIGQLLMKVETDGQAVDEKSEKKPAEKPKEQKPSPQSQPAAAAAKAEPEKAAPQPAEKPAPARSKSGGTLPDFGVWGAVERKPITATRKKIAETLTLTWANVPQVTQYGQADITTLEEFRRQSAGRVKDAGGKLTLTAIALKAVAAALEAFPNFNASFDAEKDEIVYKKYCHLSVAVDTDRGLLVPVIRDVDRKSLLEVAVELTSLAERTRQKKVTPEEMVGGNFTVSNLGGLGGGAFAPILYWPQAGILGIGRAVRQPVYVEDAVEPRLMVPLSLSYDHRIIDGADGVRFVRRVVEILENPFLLALD